MALGLDILAICLTVVVAAAGQGPVSSWFGRTTDYVPGLDVAGPLVVLAWVGCIFVRGGYDRRTFGATADEFERVLYASVMCAAIVGVASFMVRFDLSRGWFFLTFGIGTVAVLGERAALRWWLKREREHGRLSRRVVIVGDEAHVDSVAAVLARESWLGYDVVGAMSPPSEGEETTAGIPIIADTTSISQTAAEAGADVVFVAGGAVTSPEDLREIAWELEHDHAQLVVAPSISDVSAERVRVRPVGGLPLIHVEKPRAAKAARRAKRVFDVLGAGTVLLLLSPVFVALMVWVKVHDRGPVFFRQQRIGRDADEFSCWKFRTMAVDAEERLKELLAEQGLEHGAFAKLKVDPRITKPGHLLRRLSLDELPQLFNVVKGDMSLVGPRPQTSDEVEHYDHAMARRLHVRPGMTGLWQVSGRSDLPLEESVRLDNYYVDNWSMLQDLSILGRTVGAVIRSRGAY